MHGDERDAQTGRVLCQGDERGRAGRKDDVRCDPYQLRGVNPCELLVAGSPPNLDPKIAIDHPSVILEPLLECCDADERLRIALGKRHQHSDDSHSAGRLRRDPLRPKESGARSSNNELPPLHSITSSARASSEGGMARPSDLAVLRLITNSNLVG